MSRREIVIVMSDDSVEYYGTTTTSDFEFFEWINGVLFIWFGGNNVKTYNPASPEIVSIKAYQEED